MTKTTQLNGTVLRIERSSIHDGQGLRTVLFLKGCPLRCAWCSTPESQRPVLEKGHAKERCRRCGLCVEVCPAGALSLDREGDGLRIDSNKCRSCFVCVDKCPTGALRKYGYPMSVEQAAAEIAKDEIFFFHSGGGVTISGGEPLSQARFTEAVLKDCNRLGIHTAIETCLFAPWGDVEMVLPWLDVMYADIKIIDGALHKKLTGADNGLILENLRRIDASPYNIEIIARVPMIPGITDTDENLSETVRFLSSINKLKGIELLPYHRLGTDTYRHLGREYGLKGLVPPTRQRVSERRKYLTQLMKKYGMGG